MKMHRLIVAASAAILGLAVATSFVKAAETATFATHAPIRPLPTASDRPLAQGPAYYVDSAKGNDSAAGSIAAPWKSINAAASHLKPGDTLYLRGGTYYEAVVLKITGTKEQPITIRSYPNELAIVDGGIAEFFNNPADAWVPAASGVADEYESVRAYPNGGGTGNFGDSMIPFQRYLTFEDLRSKNELFLPSLENRSADPTGIYGGPGVKRDPDTNKIHVRLAHTNLDGLGDNAYTGETDPRKIPLVISGTDYTVALESAQNLRLQDFVIRGGHRTELRVEACTNIELDGLTMYGGSSVLDVTKTHGLLMTDSALRGFGAPWHSRFIHKDRSKSGYIFAGNGDNFEFANCEFTDNHDGLQFAAVDGFKFHNNLVENINDDAMEPGAKKAHGTTYIYCNYFSRLLSPFTVHGKAPVPVVSDEGTGVYLFRNVVDLRAGTYETPPTKPDPTGAYLHAEADTIVHDHGSPLQSNYYVYQNTFVMSHGAFRNGYALSWGGRTTQTVRRVFNNICFQVDGAPGSVLTAKPEDDFQADGNLQWSLHDGGAIKGDLLAKFHASSLFETSKAKYPAGWTTHDVVADPKFVGFNENYHEPSDLRLSPGSPAIDAGQTLPSEWPDPLRASDSNKPDIGAVPAGVEPWRVGVKGRLSAFGN